MRAIRCCSSAGPRRPIFASCGSRRKVLALHGTVISDQNRRQRLRALPASAAVAIARLRRHLCDGLAPSRRPGRLWRHRSQKCAEVLVPHRVEARFLTGAYVVDEAAKARLDALGFALPVTVSSRAILPLRGSFAMFKALIGDLFESRAQTLVNTVNCVGVMGKGVAEQFKRRFPAMFEDYKARC